MAELTDQQRDLVWAHRAEVDTLRNDYGRWAHVANATEAVLQVAGGTSVAEVARRMGQPEWRVGFWCARVAELGAAGIEVGYLPPGALDVEPRSLKVGIGFDCDLTTAAVADWARSSWVSEGLGIDLADDAIFLVWPKSMEVFGIDSSERRLDFMREYYGEKWTAPPGASIVAFSVEFQGHMSDPDTVNRAIEIAAFLEEVPDTVWFDP